MESRRVVFKIFSWSFEDQGDTGNKELILHIGGRTADNKSVHCIVNNFYPWVYLELPEKSREQTIDWKNKVNMQKLISYIKFRLGDTKNDHGEKNVKEVNYVQKKKLHCEEKCFALQILFRSFDCCRKVAYMFNNPNAKDFWYEGLHIKAKSISVHEDKIDPIIKFATDVKIDMAGWIEVTEDNEAENELSVEDKKFTTADIDLKTTWKNVRPYQMKNTVIVRSKYISFDIECYSQNHNSKLSDAMDKNNKIICIGNTIGQFGIKKMEHVEFRLCREGDEPLPIKNTKIYYFSEEKDLLLAWSTFVIKEDPDCLVGYNIMKFDWDYMIKRAKMSGATVFDNFSKLSRIMGRVLQPKLMSWNSSAYGQQQFSFMDPIGRINLDVMIEIERNYKLPKYNLDTVSEIFLGEHKEDLSPRQLFILFKLYWELYPEIDKFKNHVGALPREDRVNLKKSIITIFPMRWSYGSKKVNMLRKGVKKLATYKDFLNWIRKTMQIIGEYCIQDTILPVTLAEKLSLWTSMEETSNIMNIPMSYLHTRGQQIKVLAQVYKNIQGSQFIIPTNKKDKSDVKYRGAIVIGANKGDHSDVATFDFESLYPTTMITDNICYTTYVRKDDPIDDKECNIIEGEDHVCCPHDPEKRKSKKKDKSDIICQKYRYRFRKLIILPSGEIRNEGVMPKLERNLLSQRKIAKKELAKAEARMKMHKGEATEEDIKFYKMMSWEIISKDFLEEDEEMILGVIIKVLNARQLALKVSANSAYGSMGASQGFIPLIEGAASVTAMGRCYIMKTKEYILGKYNGNTEVEVMGRKFKPHTKLVYGDTDSLMIKFPDMTVEEIFVLCEKISKEATHFLKCWKLGVDEKYTMENKKTGISYTLDKYPRDQMDGLSDQEKILIHHYNYIPLNLQFENLYKRYFLLSKKRYIAYTVTKKGKITGMTKKGVVLARRDNSQYLRDVYKAVTTAILNNEEEKNIMYILYDYVNKLFTRQIPDANLIIYTGIKNIIDYATKKVNGKKEVVDASGRLLSRENLSGPLDPRLVYPNLPQVLLTLKMLRRGDDVPPNTRLEYVYIDCPDAVHQGEKAEDYTFYRENRIELGLKPDYIHYIEKQLCKPLSEVLEVKFIKNIIPHEDLDKSFERCISEIKNLYLKSVIKGITTFKKEIPKRVYNFKGKMAQVSFILNSLQKKRQNPKLMNEIDPIQNAELIKVSLTLKSKFILNKLSDTYHAPKRRGRFTIRKIIPVKTEDENNYVVLTKDILGYKKGDLAMLLDLIKEGDDLFYKLQMDDLNILEGIPRDHITTFRYRDSDIMYDILNARKCYKNIVLEMNKIFSRKNLTENIKEEDD